MEFETAAQIRIFTISDQRLISGERIGTTTNQTLRVGHSSNSVACKHFNYFLALYIRGARAPSPPYESLREKQRQWTNATKCSGFKSGAFGGVALFAVIFYASGIPRVQRDILQKIPFVGSYFIKEIPASDNVSSRQLSLELLLTFI